MHDDEVEFDEALVRRLLAGQFPQWAELPLRRFASSGTVNALYRLGDDMVVRLPLVPSHAADAAAEHAWLPRLAPLLPVPVPVPLGEGLPTDDYAGHWSVSSWLPGDNPVAGELAEPALLAADLADFVAAVRRIDLPDAPPAYRGGPLALLDAGARKAIGELDGMIDTAAATTAWESALRAPRWQGPPVWAHADLMPGNLLVQDGRLVAVIDWATAGVGDPACDLIVAWNLLPEQVRPAFRAALGVDDATWARGRGLALAIALIQLPYYQHTNLVMAANSRHTITAVLTDPHG